MSGVGEILKAIGDFGPFQKCLVLLTLIPCLSVAFHQFCQLFMVVNVPHHCDTSWILTVGPNLTQEEQLNLTLPRDANGEYEQCSMYSPVDWDLDSIVEYGLNSTQKCSSGWVYPSAEPPSLLTEFDLVCDRKDLNDIGQSIYMAGLFLGSMIFGPLSDRIGRRPVILISVFLQGVFGLGIAFVPHFYVYMAFRCVVGASVSGITMTILALATEWIGVSSRPKAVLGSHCCFAIGQMILAGLSYGIRNWRLLEIAGSAPIFSFFFFIGPGLSHHRADAGEASAELSTSPWDTELLRAAAALPQVTKCGLWRLNVGAPRVSSVAGDKRQDGGSQEGPSEGGGHQQAQPPGRTPGTVEAREKNQVWKFSRSLSEKAPPESDFNHVLCLVREQLCLLWTESERDKFWPGHLPDSACLWGSGNPSPCWLYLHSAVVWEEETPDCSAGAEWPGVSDHHWHP
ncbi:solute carrier family 22 member 14-like isoform X3 [Pithys albifrons albifrons]|uniref:solute carrier family 22 member 14-like isoform X3 n=1 Tax=Pithys albifrons albifrons TaxID=3385563 RepID=UPI003A5CB44B